MNIRAVVLIFVFFLLITGGAIYSWHSTRIATMLVGSWRDENSLVEYWADGTKIGTYDFGVVTHGKWSVEKDVIVCVPDASSRGHITRQKIVSLDQGSLVITNLADGKTYHATRVSPKPVEGLWGGKWDDKWPVFLTVTPGDRKDTYRVQYTWLENVKDHDFSSQEIDGQKVVNHIEAGFLILKVEGDSGILYGAFGHPRMAYLVRMPISKMPEISSSDSVLREYGWKSGTIPAADALALVKGP